MKISILDDEKHAGQTLKIQLIRLGRSESDISVFSSVYEALRTMPSLRPDVLFLDIEMPGLNGFQFLEELKMNNLKVIFTTAYDQFALKAFRVNALDYLLKPIEDEALAESLQRVSESAPSGLENVQAAFESIAYENTKNEKLALPSVHGMDFIRKEGIILCRSESNYTRIFMENNQKILVAKTLKEIESLLKGGPFYRVHHSFLINLNRIDRYIKSNGGSLLMENQMEVKISRQRKDEVLKRLME